MDKNQFIRYVILLNKVANKETTQEVINSHVQHLKKLDHEGKLVLSGPFIDYPSGIVIIKAKDKEEAILIAESDPFVCTGVRSFEVRTWLVACRENNYLLK